MAQSVPTQPDEVGELQPAELKRLKEALRASEGKFRRLFDSGIFAACLAKRAGPITDVNDAFVALTGYTREDVAAGRVDWGRLTLAEGSRGLPDACRDADERGLAGTYEGAYIRKDGT